MKLLFANNALSALAGGITNVATTLAVQAGHGARFPAPAVGEGFYLTLFQVIAGIESNYEVVLVTARSVDTLTIVRGQDSTTARAFNAGDSVSHRPTAQTMRSFAQPSELVAFGVTPTAPTAVAGTNTTALATTQFTKTEIANAISALVASSPAALDTLKELADALGGDANFATTTATALGNRLRVDTAAQGLSGAQQTNAKTNLALQNVDNTSDANKPVSTAQATAIALKAPIISPTFQGDVNTATVNVSHATGETGFSAYSGTGYGRMFYRSADKHAGLYVFDGVTGSTRLRAIGPDGLVSIAESGAGNVVVGKATDDGSGAKLQVLGAVKATGMTVGGTSYLNGDVNLSGALPLLTLNETDQAGTLGKWRMVADSGGLRMDLNTHANRDFTTYVNGWALNSLGQLLTPTPTAGDNSTRVATTQFVRTEISALVASSPAALDTLGELATALGNDANFATTTATAMGNRLRVDAAQGLTAPQQTTAKTNLALENVNNTSDANKPVSTAQAAAIATKAALAGSAAQDFAAKDLAITSMNGAAVAGMRNAIINGDMRIDQRGSGSTGYAFTASTFGLTLDRWGVSCAAGSLTVKQVADAPAGFANSLQVTAGTAVALPASGGSILYQNLEGFSVEQLGWGTAAAKSITISKWVKASIAGNYGVNLRNDALTRYFTASFNIPVANVWTLVSVTIPGCTDAVWATGANRAVYLSWDMGVGASLNTAATGAWAAGGAGLGLTAGVKLTSNTGATFNITGVQWEQGATATTFERRPYPLELVMCQRYYQIIGGADILGAAFNSADIMFPLRFPVPMRTAPTMQVNSWGAVIGNNGTASGQGGAFGAITSTAAQLDLTAVYNLNNYSTVTGLGYVLRNADFRATAEI